jgi:hypothetical protein
VRLHDLVDSHRELAKRLDELEQQTEVLAMSHDTFRRQTRNQLKQVFNARRELTTPPELPKLPIGFIDLREKRKWASAANGKVCALD